MIENINTWNSFKYFKREKKKWWWGMDSNHRRRCQQIYSLPPLATREPHQIEIITLTDNCNYSRAK